jgi:hypothetical protein
VNILDSVSPVAICNDLDILLDLETGTVTITAEDIDNGSYDNCGIESLSIDRNLFDCTHIGENLVVLTVTDFSGNTSVCIAIVNVN